MLEDRARRWVPTGRAVDLGGKVRDTSPRHSLMAAAVSPRMAGLNPGTLCIGCANHRTKAASFI
ncbi:hypothetical protein CKO25_18605 [Thiocapsa imhoffii]|uniref:Uncharacterized protein n=1 Tax=Thiocapsa imhoffii TaxID=382777 RepID=A0A9X1BBG1_9GAMM|nr:hypothetical protein [Thiocapsa imhoffii]